jgi:hypothetical protein
MLRITWILPGGGVLLAVILFALAFRAPDRSHSQLMPNVTRMRVAMIEQGKHPEWSQFLILGAIQRASELNSLRELPNAPARTDTAPTAPTSAHLPADRSADPEDNNDEIVLSVQAPTATVPVDIGAFLSVQPVAARDEKQPVAIQKEKPTVAALDERPVAIREEEKLAVATPGQKSTLIKTPRRVKSRNESRVKGVQHVRSRARAPAKQEPPSRQYYFEPFGNQPMTRQTSAAKTTNYLSNQQARQAPTPNANNYFGNQQNGQTQNPNASNY